MNTLTFDNSDKMTAFGLGTWKSEPGEVKKAVIKAIEIGYRHIDCAMIYGNEKEIGEAFTHCFAEGIVKREELWVTSKLWNDSHRKEHVAPALQKTLDDLQLDYLDLYLIHWPVAFKHGTTFGRKPEDFESLEEVPLTETWSGMEAVKASGKARHIGVCNFSIDNLQILIDKGQEKPEMNQVELHPLLQQQKLVDFCHDQGIHVTAYSPLGSMDRDERMKKENEPRPMENPVIKKIAEIHKCSPAQILIAWALQRGTAVIPKSTNPGRLAENFKSQEITLSEGEMKEINALDAGARIIDGSFFERPEKGYTLEKLWG